MAELKLEEMETAFAGLSLFGVIRSALISGGTGAVGGAILGMGNEGAKGKGEELVNGTAGGGV